MQNACMTVITIRNVPEELSEALKARAAEQGQSLQQFLLRQLFLASSSPALNKQRWADFLAKVPRVNNPDITREDVIRAIHEGRREEA